MVEAGGQIGKPETISPKLAESAPKYHPWTPYISRISETASRFFKRVSPETLTFCASSIFESRFALNN